MIERFFSYLKSLPGASPSERLRSSDETTIAMVALLIMVISADGEHNRDEYQTLETALKQRYKLSDREVAALMKAAERAAKGSDDFNGLIDTLNRELDEHARTDFVNMMWQVALADGKTLELEENLVWRIADLLGVADLGRKAMSEDDKR